MARRRSRAASCGRTPDVDAECIEFEAVVARVQTMADGGLRVVLDLPEDKVYEVAWMIECKRQQATVKVMVTSGDQ
jgi:hypothetical protein